jgi:hypothetical protein
MEHAHMRSITLLITTIPLTPSMSLADAYIVDFTATAGDGPLSGLSYNGSFTFDASPGDYSSAPTAFDFTFFNTYSLSDTSREFIVFNSGTVTPKKFAFMVASGNDVASGTPDFYLSLGEGIPSFQSQVGGSAHGCTGTGLRRWPVLPRLWRPPIA